jgi:hypothetical protein
MTTETGRTHPTETLPRATLRPNVARPDRSRAAQTRSAGLSHYNNLVNPAVQFLRSTHAARNYRPLVELVEVDVDVDDVVVKPLRLPVKAPTTSIAA